MAIQSIFLEMINIVKKSRQKVYIFVSNEILITKGVKREVIYTYFL